MTRATRPKALIRVDTRLGQRSFIEIKSIAKARALTKRVLSHALVSNLRNVTMTEFKAIDGNTTHGQMTITMTYPYKPAPKR